LIAPRNLNELQSKVTALMTTRPVDLLQIKTCCRSVNGTEQQVRPKAESSERRRSISAHHSAAPQPGHQGPAASSEGPYNAHLNCRIQVHRVFLSFARIDDYDTEQLARSRDVDQLASFQGPGSL